VVVGKIAYAGDFLVTSMKTLFIEEEQQ